MSTKPAWISPEMYPFPSSFFDTGKGRIHYVDVGDGPPIVMTHGNPSWSFLYRHIIKELSKTHRCIAIDNLGFGLSDKPVDVDYTIDLHARNAERLVEHLGLTDVTLMVHDWGGPIGLSYALNHPENVRRIVLFNTWLWPVNGDKHYESFSGFMGGRIGRFLNLRLNFFVNVIMKKAAGKRSVFTKEVLRHYRMALPDAESRLASASLPAQILGAGRWLERAWNRREAIAGIPTLIIWGAKDIAFREQELRRWTETLKNHELVHLADTGHYIQEESPDQVIPIIRAFLEKVDEHAPATTR